MKLILTTIAACALLPLGALAQNSFPAPPPELSVSTESGLSIAGETGMLDEGFVIGEGDVFFAADGPAMMMAQATAPAPPQGAGNTVYMTQGPGGPGRASGPGPGDHFQMRTMGPRKWWKDSDTVKQLGLSDGQATQIEQAFTDSKMRLIDMVAALQKEELKLETLINADQPNENAVSNQVDQVVQARGKLEKEHAMMMLSIRRLLSAEQWKKLQTIDGGMGMGMGHHMFVRKFHGPPQGPPPPDGPQAPQ